MQIPLYRTECLISRFIGKYTDRANHSGRNKYIYLHSNVENTLSELPFPRSESLELPKYRRHILDLGSSGGILIISREVRDWSKTLSASPDSSDTLLWFRNIIDDKLASLSDPEPLSWENQQTNIGKLSSLLCLQHYLMTNDYNAIYTIFVKMITIFLFIEAYKIGFLYSPYNTFLGVYWAHRCFSLLGYTDTYKRTRHWQTIKP